MVAFIFSRINNSDTSGIRVNCKDCITLKETELEEANKTGCESTRGVERGQWESLTPWGILLPGRLVLGQVSTIWLVVSRWREKNSPCYAGILCWGYDDVLIVFNGERPSAEVDKILFHRPHMKSVLLKDYSYNALRDGLPPTIVKPQPFKQEIAYIKKYILGH